ncbi:GtrA family protein [Lusitaniella coriacea LEGE 07157]|uniref:GtrA family protein n=1 Tax=Lusitaniella coriacea LEGE 07157 TaxID=945747 RepID=A0A8J7DZ37_9CYAN|nr:GtrA family protein [Lusitaniella coriacea]MBE9117957.1 GtrA family protein [Lusitaniella coriacea LEGE 07157]
MVRWWAIGLFFTGANIPLLGVMKDVLHIPWLIATLISTEIVTLLRFPLNDRWVFGYPRPTWKRLWQYHVANISSTVIWVSAANLFPLLGIPHLIGAVLATGVSVGWSMMTNFLWVWRKKGTQQASSPKSPKTRELLPKE